MLLNTEELLALANGDVEPDRLAVLLDRLEHCADSAAALQVLVSLKANREEALEALRTAAESDAPSTVPLPHPHARPAPMTGWVPQGLRLAASIALIGILGVWAATSFFEDGPEPAHALATTDYVNIHRAGGELTADASDVARLAGRALDDHRYEDARALLADEPYDEDGMVPLYLGMSQYWLEDYEAAAATLAPIQNMPSVEDSGVKLQALWYEANALLALDRPWGALPLVEKITTGPGVFPLFTDDAIKTLDALSTLLGINKAGKG